MHSATIKIIDAQQAKLRNNYKNTNGPNGPKHVGAIMKYFNCIF